MPKYLVRWDLEIEAESPEEAAEWAKRLLNSKPKEDYSFTVINMDDATFYFIHTTNSKAESISDDDGFSDICGFQFQRNKR